MKNATKYLGFSIIVIVLLVNSFLMNGKLDKITRQMELMYAKQNEILWELGKLNQTGVNNNTNKNTQIKDLNIKEVMSPLGLSEYLGISLDKVYSLVENKESKIPYINIDGEYKFNKSAIDEWMKTSKDISTKQ